MKNCKQLNRYKMEISLNTIAIITAAIVIVPILYSALKSQY